MGSLFIISSTLSHVKMGAVESNCVNIDGVSMFINIVWYINLLMIINSQNLNLIMTISEIYIA